MKRAATMTEYAANEKARQNAISHNRADRMRKNPMGQAVVPAKLGKPQVIVAYDDEGGYYGTVENVDEVPAGYTWKLEDKI